MLASSILLHDGEALMLAKRAGLDLKNGVGGIFCILGHVFRA